MAARVGVVIATYESHAVLPDLLDTLEKFEPDVPVVIVDDASPSGPVDARDHQLIVNEEALGYAGCCNRGAEALRRRGARYVAFLNPDVRLQGPSLTELADLLARRRKVGIATGPVVDPRGRRLPSAWGPTSVRRALAFAAGFEPVRLRAAAGTMMRSRVAMSEVSTLEDDVRVEGHVIGGTLFARRKCLDDIGGFDDSFFLYWEDADLCHRARDAGWDIRVLPVTPFMHMDPPSPGEIDEEQRWEWFVVGAKRFGSKHLVPGQAVQLEAALELGRRLAKLRQRG